MSKELTKIAELRSRIALLERQLDDEQRRSGVTMFSYFSGKNSMPTRTDLASILGLSVSSVNQKMRGATPFTFSEAYLVAKHLRNSKRAEAIDWGKTIEFFGARSSDLGILKGSLNSAVLKTKVGDKGRV